MWSPSPAPPYACADHRVAHRQLIGRPKKSAAQKSNSAAMYQAGPAVLLQLSELAQSSRRNAPCTFICTTTVSHLLRLARRLIVPEGPVCLRVPAAQAEKPCNGIAATRSGADGARGACEGEPFSRSFRHFTSPGSCRRPFVCAKVFDSEHSQSRDPGHPSINVSRSSGCAFGGHDTGRPDVAPSHVFIHIIQVREPNDGA